MQLRLRELRGHMPIAIHVLAHQIAAIVAQKHSVRINHWHNFKDKILTQHLRYGMIAHQELDEALTDMRGGCLARVCSAKDDDDANEASVQTIGRTLIMRHLINSQHIHIPILLSKKRNTVIKRKEDVLTTELPGI